MCEINGLSILIAGLSVYALYNLYHGIKEYRHQKREDVLRLYRRAETIAARRLSNG